MIIRSNLLALFIFIIFAGGIGGTMAFNLWRTESDKIPAVYTSGEFAGQYNPADIRGSYSFSDISELFNIPIQDLVKAFGVSDLENPEEFECKELEELYGEVDSGEIGTDSARLFVALYNGLPYTPEETTRLPISVLSVLKERMNQEQLDDIRSLTVQLSKRTSTQTDHDAETSDERIVKGKTTFKDLLDWGLSKQEIEQILDFPMGPSGVTVRDACIDKNVEFSTVKSKLQELVDER